MSYSVKIVYLRGDKLAYEVKWWVAKNNVYVVYEALNINMEVLEEEVVVSENPALKYLGAEELGESKGFLEKIRGA